MCNCVKKSLVIMFLLLCLCVASACAEAQATTDVTSSAQTEASFAELTSSPAESAVAAETAPVPVPDSEYESSADEIAAAMTVDYDAEQRAYYEDDVAILLIAAHWEPVYVLSRWEENFPVRELELELDDEKYGHGKARFRGSSLDEILTFDEGGLFHVFKVVVYNRLGDEFIITREEIVEKEMYLMAYCEDKLFGSPEDGGVGPLVLMSTKDGKAEIVGINIMQMVIRRDIDPGMAAWPD